MLTGPRKSSVCIVRAHVPRFPCLSQLRSRFPTLLSGLTQQPELGYRGMLKLTPACVYRTEKQEQTASCLTFTSFHISRSAPAWELPADDTHPAQTSALSRQHGQGGHCGWAGRASPQGPLLARALLLSPLPLVQSRRWSAHQAVVGLVPGQPGGAALSSASASKDTK